MLSPQAAQLAAAVYGFAGPALLRRQLDLLLGGRRGLWSVLDSGARFLFERKAPYRHEPDLVGRIGYRELNYGAVPDGKPLDPAIAFREFATNTTEFEAEPFDLSAEMPRFTWPTVVISGGRDLITPPAVARRIASLIPGAVLVSLATAGHSAVDLRERAALDIIKAICDGTSSGLPARAKKLDSAPGGLGVRLLIWGIAAAAAVEKAFLPWFPVRCNALRLHEADLAVVRVGKAEGAEVRQSAADRDVSGRLGQRQAETLGPDQLVELVGQVARLGRVEFVERLLDLGVDLRAADLAEVAFCLGRVDLRQPATAGKRRPPRRTGRCRSRRR